jgi:hypothetical protein
MMKPMRSKKVFMPVAGLMVAGLIGTAYATCYGYQTYTCATTDMIVGYYYYGSSGYLPCDDPNGTPPGTGQERQVYAKNTWTVDNAAYALGSGQSGYRSSDISQADCTGTGFYIDCTASVVTVYNFSGPYLPTVSAISNTTAAYDCSS